MRYCQAVVIGGGCGGLAAATKLKARRAIGCSFYRA